MSDVNKIIICGNGLAANLTALALQESLPATIQIERVNSAQEQKQEEQEQQQDDDLFYGSITTPDIYDFHLQLNVSEPDIVLRTNSTFSYGSYFNQWGLTNRSWVQCFHLALPVEQGISFQHLIARQNHALEPYLISAQAALKGKFAHPPEDPRNPLSRAEFGYHFNPEKLSQLYAAKLNAQTVKVHQHSLSQVEVENGEITALTLTNGEQVKASLYIDCTGASSQLLTAIAPDNTGKNTRKNSRRLGAIKEFNKTSSLGSACRQITSLSYGWQMDTPLQDGVDRLTVFDIAHHAQAMQQQSSESVQHCVIETGAREHAWLSNCVAIGHAANVIEPLTPAPCKMLVADIQRLLELLPNSTDMRAEANEYNRRFAADTEYTNLFYGALFSFSELPNSDYWQAAFQATQSDKLTRKLTQFQHRGILVSYDLEPFNEQDWLILHYGMKRNAENYDLQVEKIPSAQLDKALRNMQTSILQLVNKMPSHALYMDKLTSYLQK